jgi:hypothetical protein
MRRFIGLLSLLGALMVVPGCGGSSDVAPLTGEERKKKEAEYMEAQKKAMEEAMKNKPNQSRPGP